MESIDREKFYRDMEKFFTEGLVREIYSDDKICICNMANQVYAAFCYLDIGFGQVCFVERSSVMKQLVEKPEELLFVIKACLKDRKLSSRIDKMDKKMYDKLKYFKALRDVEGPSSDIDFDFEAEMMELSKSKQGMSR